MSQYETVVKDEAVEEVTTEAESTPVVEEEPKADELLDILSSDDDSPTITEAKPEEKPEEVEEPEEEPEAPEPIVDEVEEKPLSKADERKAQLNAEIRDMVAERNALKESIEKLNAETYKPQTAEELVEEGYSEEVAEVRALKQELELQQYNQKVLEAQTNLSEQATQVMKDYPIFDPDSPDYVSEIADSAAQALASSLILDPNTNQIVGTHLSPYQIYKPIADAYKLSQVKGKLQGQRATEKMLASVDAQPSATPKKPKSDPLLDILSSDD